MSDLSCFAPTGTVTPTLLRRLVNVLQPELIFCRNRHLLFVLSNYPSLALKDYQQKLKACRLPKHYTHAFLFHCELERQHRLGNLFISTFCIPANCIYQNERTSSLPLWQQIQAVRETALLHFSTGIHKAKAFFQGACFYWASSNSTMAAFMLHQACELCLRAVVMAFTGEQVKTHTLAEQMQHVKKYLPELAAFFNGKTEKEKLRLHLLEKAYSHARYTYTYEIATADLLPLLQQVGQLHETTEQLMQQTFQSYPGYIPASESGLFPSNPRKNF